MNRHLGRYSLPRRGFTLVELLVVIAIIGTLVGLLLPAVQSARESARRSTCSNNLKQLSLAMHNHHDARKMLPPGSAGGATYAPETITPAGELSYVVRILPFLELQNLYDLADLSKAYTATPFTTSFNTVQVAGLLCPSAKDNKDQTSPTSFAGHYQGVMGPRGAIPDVTPSQNYRWGGSSWLGSLATQGTLGVNSKVKFDSITDGLSTTLMLGELSWADAKAIRVWTRGYSTLSTAVGLAKNVVNPINATPNNGSSNFNDVSFGSEHAKGCFFGKADGSVAFIDDMIAMSVYFKLASRNGGEQVSLP
jgi:prepilin-type N-terminal cleavage/methylation domain-containing protein